MYRANRDSPILQKQLPCHGKNPGLLYDNEWSLDEMQQLLRMMGKDIMSVDAMRTELQTRGVDFVEGMLRNKEGNAQALRRTKHLFLSMISHLDKLVAHLVAQGDLIEVT